MGQRPAATKRVGCLASVTEQWFLNWYRTYVTLQKTCPRLHLPTTHPAKMTCLNVSHKTTSTPSYNFIFRNTCVYKQMILASEKGLGLFRTKHRETPTDGSLSLEVTTSARTCWRPEPGDFSALHLPAPVQLYELQEAEIVVGNEGAQNGYKALPVARNVASYVLRAATFNIFRLT